MLDRAQLLSAAAALAGVPLLLTASSPAQAAVRQCKAPVAASGVHPSSELEAKKAAVDQWIAAARLHGEGFMSWRLAHQRSLTCSAAAGGILCQAVGSPCIISQTPDKPTPRAPAPPLPPGKRPTDA